MIDLNLRAALINNLSDLDVGDHIVVGVSGGADSIALLKAAVHVGKELDLRVGAVIINHQIQDNAFDVAQKAAELSRQLGAQSVEIIPVSVATGKGSGGLEAAARDARRSAFETHAAVHDVKAVLLGHTQDDQAETVILGLARGSGARSLSGMQTIDGLYRRPFLWLSRDLVRATVANLEIYEDPHNDDSHFARVRVRREVLPVLERELGKGIIGSLARTADMLHDDADALDAFAMDAMTDEIEELQFLDRAVRTRVLRMLALRAGALANDLTRDHVLAIDQLITDWRGQGPLNLPGNVDVSRAHGKLIFNKTA
jgi:tRNA(Ile)-lysidine synthase